MPTKIEKIKQAKLDTAIKQAQLKAAKKGTPAAADDAVAKPKGIIGKTVDVGKKAALAGTAGTVGYEYLKDPQAGLGQAVGRGVETLADLTGKAFDKTVDFAGDVVKGYADADAARTGSGKDKSQVAVAPTGSSSATDTATDSATLPQTGYSSVRWSKTPATMDRPPEILPPGEFKFQEAAGKPSDDEATLAALQYAIYGQESGHGKVKTNKPNYAGAIGPMQIMPRTWEGLKRQGLIPKDYDIYNPEHNMAGGNAHIKDLYYKYGKDPAKAAAVYYGGPRAINKQGNIVSGYIDKKNPDAPSAIGYSKQILARMAATGPDGKIAAKPPITTGGITVPAVATTAAVGTDLTKLPTSQPVAQPAAGETPDNTGGLLDLNKLSQAMSAGEDMYDLSRFLKPTVPPGKLAEAKVTLKYYNFLNQNLVEQQSVGAELAKTSGGQFTSRADRLDQTKVDSVLGAGKFKAGSAEANLALAKYFKQQSADTGQGTKPTPPKPAAVGAASQNPYTTARDVTGLGALGAAGASMAGSIAPKVAGVAAKVLPGLNVAYQGADALRRASIGDTTGSAISAAGAVPILAVPAVAAQAVRDKYRTGSFFPSDEELKAAVDKDKGQSSQVKEGTRQMNKRTQLQKRIQKLEEDKSQLIKRLDEIGVLAKALKTIPSLVKNFGAGVAGRAPQQIRSAGKFAGFAPGAKIANRTGQAIARNPGKVATGALATGAGAGYLLGKDKKPDQDVEQGILPTPSKPSRKTGLIHSPEPNMPGPKPPTDKPSDQETPGTYWDNRGKDRPEPAAQPSTGAFFDKPAEPAINKPSDQQDSDTYFSSKKPTNIDVEATAARDRIQQMMNRSEPNTSSPGSQSWLDKATKTGDIGQQKGPSPGSDAWLRQATKTDESLDRLKLLAGLKK